MPLPHPRPEGPKKGQPLAAEPGAITLNRRRFLAEAAAGAIAITSCGRQDSRTTAPAAIPPITPVKFTDITQAAGLSLVQKRGGCGMFYYVEQEAAGAALFDADGDGF